MLISVLGFGSLSAQEKAKALETGTFHGKVHNTSGRATIYREADGHLVLRLTNFKTSNGPDVHVALIAEIETQGRPVAARLSARTRAPRFKTPELQPILRSK
jgi:hypothetical protein